MTVLVRKRYHPICSSSSSCSFRAAVGVIAAVLVVSVLAQFAEAKSWMSDGRIRSNRIERPAVVTTKSTTAATATTTRATTGTTPTTAACFVRTTTAVRDRCHRRDVRTKRRMVDRRQPHRSRRSDGSNGLIAAFVDIGTRTTRTTRTKLRMGVLDTISDFLSNRRGDFVKLDYDGDDNRPYGPGPLLVLYRCPSTILDDEIYDMIEDGAPRAHRNKPNVFRIDENDSDGGDDVSDSELHPSKRVLDVSLREALETIMTTSPSGTSPSSDTSTEAFQIQEENGGAFRPSITPTTTTAATESEETARIPVLYFSGFYNDEMMSVYDILGKEIYQETLGQCIPACAKAVPNAMKKPFRQVLEEISGDHQDAIRMDDERDDDGSENNYDDAAS